MYTGIYCPAVSMFDREGALDLDNWGTHLDNLIEGGIHGIFALGSAGEFFAMPQQTRLELVDFAVDRVAGRVPVLIGVGGAVMPEVLEMVEHAGRIGASGVVTVGPYYFTPDHDSAARHFNRVAEASELPVWLYNFPRPTGFDLTPALARQLCASHQNIVAIKDTVDVPGHTRDMITQVGEVRDDIAIFSGTDDHYLYNRLAGGAGVVGALGNVDPGLFAALHAAYEATDLAAVQACYRRLNVLMRLYSAVEGHVLGGVRIAVKLQGIDYQVDTLSPQTAVTAEQTARVESILTAAAEHPIPQVAAV